MKKLIALAAVACAGAAIAANCTLTPDPVKTYNAVYNWKFTGKTTVGYLLSNTTTSGGSACTIGTTTTTKCAIRVPGSLAIQGYTYVCGNCCTSFKETTGNTGSDKFYMTKPYKTGLTTAIAIDVANVIGKSAKQYEVEGKATFISPVENEKAELTFAGLGSFNSTQKTVTSASGNFAGTVVTPFLIKQGACIKAVIWDCEKLPSQKVFKDDDKSVAYGTWSVKYNASASKRYNDGYTVAVPEWATK